MSNCSYCWEQSDLVSVIVYNVYHKMTHTKKSFCLVLRCILLCSNHNCLALNTCVNGFLNVCNWITRTTNGGSLKRMCSVNDHSSWMHPRPQWSTTYSPAAHLTYNHSGTCLWTHQNKCFKLHCVVPKDTGYGGNHSSPPYLFHSLPFLLTRKMIYMNLLI